jgi:predicted dehydrogenase
MVAENVRFHTTYQSAEICQIGRPGQSIPSSGSPGSTICAPSQPAPWFSPDPSGGILVSGGVHDFELLRMLSGEIGTLLALTGNKVFEEMAADDNGVALAGMANAGRPPNHRDILLRTPPRRPGLRSRQRRQLMVR